MTIDSPEALEIVIPRLRYFREQVAMLEKALEVTARGRNLEGIHQRGRNSERLTVACFCQGNANKGRIARDATYGALTV